MSIVLMGSFQNTVEANDIDLIIIYDKFNISVLKELKMRLASNIYERYKIPVHYTTLSIKEYKEMIQLHEEKHIFIYDTQVESMK